MDERLDICFVAPQCFPALSGAATHRYIGGAEMQQAVLGRALAERGHRVSFVTEDHGQADGEPIDGVCVFNAYRAEAGVPVLRFVHPRMTKLWQGMKRADAAVYYQRTSDSVTGVVAAFARAYGRKFLFAVGSNNDCLPSLGHCRTRRERVLYRYGLRRADAIIAQTEAQRRLLRSNFDVESVVVPNCGPEPCADRGASDGRVDGGASRVVWVGKLNHDKRPELLMDVAQRCPESIFDVVGETTGDSPYVRELRTRAESLANVCLHGRVSHARVRDFYARAALLLCTSQTEGFPNTFLEAWSFGLPIVTTFDPDDLIARHGLGAVAENAESLADGVRNLLADHASRREACAAVRRYYLEQHTLDRIVPRIEAVIRDLMRNPR